jgi:hypothetical protein
MITPTLNIGRRLHTVYIEVLEETRGRSVATSGLYWDLYFTVRSAGNHCVFFNDLLSYKTLCFKSDCKFSLYFHLDVKVSNYKSESNLVQCYEF